MSDKPGEITLLLHQWRNGDKEAEAQLFERLMPDLRRIAGYCFRGERAGHTFQPTALVNEAFLRLAAATNIDYHDRKHFLIMSATFMRRLLIEHARARPTVQFSPLDGLPDRFLGRYTPLETVMMLDILLDELGTKSPELRSVVELKYFLGFTDDETAEVLGISVRSMQRDWHEARRWLFERLTTERRNQPANGKHSAKG
jgi:RNA polymerase sigma factor (TIGR02999 family)